MAVNENRLVWLDMEMTGLDPEKERIIEVAVVVTEADPAVVTPPEDWPVRRLAVRGGPPHDLPDILVRDD